MNPTRKPFRWRMVALLGGSLGVLYVAAMLWLTAEDNGSLSFSQPGKAPGRAVLKPLILSQEIVRRDITKVIASQLGAFRQNDYRSAYQFAAAGIQEQMPLPAFEKMVRSGYGALAKSRSEDFGLVVDNGEEAVVNVDVVTDSGRHSHFQYLMRREHGIWRIGGVKQILVKSTFV